MIFSTDFVLDYASMTTSGHHVKPDELSILDASIPKITIMTGDEDTIVHPERSKDLHEFLPVRFFDPFSRSFGHDFQLIVNARFIRTA